MNLVSGKLISGLLLAGVLALPCAAHAEKWVVFKTSATSALAYDLDTLTVPRAERAKVAQIFYTRGAATSLERKQFNYTAENWEVDCPGKRIRRNTQTLFGADKTQVGEVLVVQAEWAPAASNGMGDLYLTLYCRNVRPDGFQTVNTRAEAMDALVAILK